MPGGIAVLAGGGARLRTGPARTAAGTPSEVELGLPPGLGDGGYTVPWRVVSADTLRREQPGSYASEALTFPMTGTWQLRISVRTSDIDQTTVLTDLPVT